MKARLYHLHALSALHCGTGQSVGVVDLPIARERATKLPMVPGSSLRGVLREDFSEGQDARTLFGPSPTDDDHFAGALAIGDASLLSLPVRCLGGIVCYATAPFILARYARDRRLAGLKAPDPVTSPSADVALMPAGSKNLVEGKLVLEDLDLRAQQSQEAGNWARHIAQVAHPEDVESQSDLEHRLAILPDGVMDFLSETGTEVRARIRVDEAKGTVQDGALWYEENLPAEAVLWGVFAVSASNDQSDQRTEPELAELMFKKRLLQLGGKAGVGRGLVRFLPEQPA